MLQGPPECHGGGWKHAISPTTTATLVQLTSWYPTGLWVSQRLRPVTPLNSKVMLEAGLSAGMGEMRWHGTITCDVVNFCRNHAKWLVQHLRQHRHASSSILADIYSRLNIMLVRPIGRAILARRSSAGCGWMVTWLPYGDMSLVMPGRPTPNHLSSKQRKQKGKFIPLLGLLPTLLRLGACYSRNIPGAHAVPSCPEVTLPSEGFKLPPDFDIMSVLRQFPRDSACGPSGLRIQHLIEAADVHLPISICSSLRANGIQQEDPLGLHKHVRSIAPDSESSELLFNLWYLDNGWLPLGLRIDTTKCELFSQCNLDGFPTNMKMAHEPNFEILGTPIEDVIFCIKFLAQKRAKAVKMLSQLSGV
eukprot:Em0007g1017a